MYISAHLTSAASCKVSFIQPAVLHPFLITLLTLTHAGDVDATVGRHMDTAVGVVASDTGLPGAPDVLFMATSREEERDNGLLAAPEWAGGNRADELTKRGLGKASNSSSLSPPSQMRCRSRTTTHLSHQPCSLTH